MKAKLILTDMPGDNEPVQIKMLESTNNVRDDNSGALRVRQTLGAVLSILNSEAGPAFAATIAAYTALLEKSAPPAANDEDDDDED